MGVSGVALIAGEAENAQFEAQQLQAKMVFRPYFTRLYPDLRAAQRFGKEREDKDPVHIWISVDTQGPFVTDIRLIFPQYMKSDTPFWNALRKAGYNKLIRPNFPEADTYPLPVEQYLKIPMVLALKVNDTEVPLCDVRLSTPFGNGSSVVSGHSEAELFQVCTNPHTSYVCIMFMFITCVCLYVCIAVGLLTPARGHGNVSYGQACTIVDEMASSAKTSVTHYRRREHR